jgi:DNA-binding GntR family transcriptional regulator
MGTADNDVDYLTLSAPLSRTLSDPIAEHLRQAILKGQLKQGQRIVERKLAEALQTSRGPVRDALKVLEHEGLLVRYPHRGTSVAQLTPEDAEEIHTLREAIESLAVRYAIKRASDEQIQELDKLVQSIAADMGREDSQLTTVTLDLEFHRTLCRISGHKRALVAWDALSTQILLLLITHRRREPADWRETGVSWHQQLADALRQRDAATAQELLHRHLANTFRSMVEQPKNKKASSAARKRS